jgi:hypothetical protein
MPARSAVSDTEMMDGAAACRILSCPAASLSALNPIWFTATLAAGLLALPFFDLPAIRLFRLPWLAGLPSRVLSRFHSVGQPSARRESCQRRLNFGFWRK